MVVRLHNTRALQRGAFATCVLLAVFPWVLEIPLWLKIASSIVALLSAVPHAVHPRRQVRALYLEPGDTLSVYVASREGAWSSHKVRSVQVLRFLRHYIEMVLEVEAGKTLRVVILPGICTHDAMRCLRKFLLRAYPELCGP